MPGPRGGSEIEQNRHVRVWVIQDHREASKPALPVGSRMLTLY